MCSALSVLLSLIHILCIISILCVYLIVAIVRLSWLCLCTSFHILFSTWHRMINTSFTISFHTAKFSLSNFLILQPIPNDKAIVLLKVFIGLVFSFNLPLLIPMLCGFQFSPIPLVDNGGVWLTAMCSRLMYYSRLYGSVHWILGGAGKRRVSVRSCVLLVLWVTLGIHKNTHMYGKEDILH